MLDCSSLEDDNDGGGGCGRTAATSNGPVGAAGDPSSASSSSNFLSTCRLELLEPTHRGLHRFVPRHSDEIEVDIGDPVYVQREADDLWCEGRPARTSHENVSRHPHATF